MTKIIHTSNGKGEYFKITGHADYNPGNDVVCAAVSTVTYGLINYLAMLLGNKEIIDLEVMEEPGDFEISFIVVDDKRYGAVKDFVIMSYEMIAENYPENVRIGGAH